MATGRLRTFVTHLQKLVVPSDDQTPDRELLRRFSLERDEPAFAEIVRRHGPMLSRLGRRVLHDGHDAEDVCQAVFLLLAQKAASLRWCDSVAGWLFQTTYHLSLKARAMAHRRTHYEARARPVPPSDPVAELSVRELQAILDDELSRLPEKYRVPILLCCLEGKSRDEAASHLGWKLATVKDRLEQGRERLRVRLARRGLLLGTGLMSAWLLEIGARASEANVTPGAIAKAAVALITRQATLAGLLPSRVAALLEGGTSPMVLSRMTIVAILGIALGFGAAGALKWLPAGASPAQAQTPPGQPAKPETTLAQPAALPLIGHQGAVRAVAFAPDGKALATAGADGTVRLWDLATGLQTLKLELPDEAAGVAFAPDGTIVAATSAGKAATLITWDAATGQELWRHGDPSSEGGAVAFSPDGSQMVARLGERGTIALDARTGKVLFDFRGRAVAAAFSPDGKLLAIGDSVSIYLLDATNGLLQNLWPHKGAVKALAFLDGGDKIGVADQAGSVRILKAAPRGKDKNGLQEVIFLPIDLSGKPFPNMSTGKEDAKEESVRAVALSPDGKKAVTAEKGGEIRLWDGARGKEERRFGAAKGAITAMAFTPDGERLAAVGENGAVVWDLTRDEKPLPKDFKLTEKELPELWDDLASDNVVRSHAAVRMLRADPGRSIPFLQERLKPRPESADEKKVKQLIADLDADEFDKREKATRELENLGKTVESALREALAAEPSLEAKKRLERLLKPLGGEVLTPERRRDVRAVRVLEQIGTPEAKNLLEALAKESPGWWVTREAKAALERLTPRDQKP